MRCVICNLFWWLGHIVSKGIAYWPDEWERSGSAIAKVYQWAMLKSLWWNDAGDCGVWAKPENNA